MNARLLLVLAISPLCGCGIDGHIAAQSRQKVPEAGNRIEFRLPFLTGQVLSYLSAYLAVEVETVIADGELVQPKPSSVIVDVMDMRNIRIDAQEMIFEIPVAESPRGFNYIVARDPMGDEPVVFEFPPDARVVIKYRIIFPDGAVSSTGSTYWHTDPNAARLGP